MTKSQIESLRMQYDHMSYRDQQKFQREHPNKFKLIQNTTISYHRINSHNGELVTGQQKYR